jgi:uncharacterized MnhB-related membrane protein
MIEALLVVGILLFGLQALRARRLLAAALWLAGHSALVAILLYRLGAREVAIIELSVGAGLVTVLFVFAIAIAGEDAMTSPGVVPKWLSLGLVATVLILLSWLILPLPGENQVFTKPAFTEAEASLAVVLWQDRALDVLVQIGLIFAAVLGILGLLSEEGEGKPAIVEARMNGRVSQGMVKPAERPVGQQAAPPFAPAEVVVEEAQA